MKWPARIALLSLLASAAVVPFAMHRTSSSRHAALSPESADVRVEHQDVVAVESATPAAAPRRTAPAPTRRPNAVRRVLLGSGIHRPEPFPRVR
jgi:hypothetical protein